MSDKPFREVQTELDRRFNRTFISRVDRLVSCEPTERGLRLRACLSRRFNLGFAQDFADLYHGYGTKAEAEAELPEFVVDFSLMREDVLRVRTSLSEQLSHNPCSDVFVEEPAEAPDFEVEEDADGVRLRTAALTLTIRRRSWDGHGVDSMTDIVSYCVHDRHGRLLIDELVDEKSIYFGYYAPPLGRARIDGEGWTVQSFRRREDEDFYGFGEQFMDFSKRGQAVHIWNGDPGNCMGTVSYKNVPFFISTRGYGVMLASPVEAVFDMGSLSSAAWTLKVHSQHLDYLIMAGDAPKDILRTYYDLTGAPALPPRWSFGLWMSSILRYQTQQDMLDAADEIRRHRLPCDVLHVDPPWMDVESLVCDLTWGKRFPNPRELIQQLRDQGFKLTLWMCAYVPMQGELYEEGLANDYFLSDAEGQMLVNPGLMNFWSEPFVYVDFTNPEAAEWYRERCRRILRDGVAVLKTDLCELGPLEARYHNGMNGVEGHNFFTREYARIVYEACRDVHGDSAMIWCRSGTVGAQRTPIHWAGDVRCNFDSMLGQLRAILGAGMSGFVFFSHDIGGFQGTPWPELYIRWFQLGMFTSHARAHGGQPHEPWAYGDEAERICREWAELRYRLMPYIYSAAISSCRERLPMLRPLILEYPHDRNVRHICDQYLFGPDFLVAPIVEDGARSRQLYLPEGDWLDWWSKEVVPGGRWIEAEAPLERIPLYLRRGAVVAETAEPGDHIDEFEPWRQVTLHIFPADADCRRVYTTAESFSEIRYSRVDGQLEIELEGWEEEPTVRCYPEG